MPSIGQVGEIGRMSEAMQDSWRAVAQDRLEAAGELLPSRRWRSVISRAYYAAYARISGALREVGFAMPTGREGPSHGQIAEIVENNLSTVRREDRRLVSGRIRRLYNLRVMADYRPSTLVDNGEAREALRLMHDVFRMLREAASA